MVVHTLMVVHTPLSSWTGEHMYRRSQWPLVHKCAVLSVLRHCGITPYTHEHATAHFDDFPVRKLSVALAHAGMTAQKTPKKQRHHS